MPSCQAYTAISGLSPMPQVQCTTTADHTIPRSRSFVSKAFTRIQDLCRVWNGAETTQIFLKTLCKHPWNARWVHINITDLYGVHGICCILNGAIHATQRALPGTNEAPGHTAESLGEACRYTHRRPVWVGGAHRSCIVLTHDLAILFACL